MEIEANKTRNEKEKKKKFERRREEENGGTKENLASRCWDNQREERQVFPKNQTPPP
jgi:hypothetical protein